MTNLSPQDFDLLSAHLDGALSATEAQKLEERLAQDAELQREWQALQMMVGALRDLPLRPAPRDFSLTPEQVGASREREPRRIITARRGWFGLASVASLLVVVGLAILINQAPPPDEPVLVAVAPTHVTDTATERLLASPTADETPEPLMQAEALTDDEALMDDEALPDDEPPIATFDMLEDVLEQADLSAELADDSLDADIAEDIAEDGVGAMRAFALTPDTSLEDEDEAFALDAVMEQAPSIAETLPQAVPAMPPASAPMDVEGDWLSIVLQWALSFLRGLVGG